MRKKALLLLAVIAIVATPAAATARPSARIWHDWSKPKHQVKVRYDDYAYNAGHRTVFEFRRGGGHAGKARVRLVWNFTPAGAGDPVSTPPPNAARTKWTKISAGQTRLLKPAKDRCDAFISVWPQISLRKHRHWAAAKTFSYRGAGAGYGLTEEPFGGC